MKNGYICFDRSEMDRAWFKDPILKHFYTHLKFNANYKTLKFEGKTIYRGQIAVGRKSLSKTLNISENQVRRCIKTLVESGDITVEPTTKFTIVTLVNYDSPEYKKSSSYSKNKVKKNNITTSEASIIINNNTYNKHNIVLPEESLASQQVNCDIMDYKDDAMRLSDARNFMEKYQKSEDVLFFEIYDFISYHNTNNTSIVDLMGIFRKNDALLTNIAQMYVDSIPGYKKNPYGYMLSIKSNLKGYTKGRSSDVWDTNQILKKVRLYARKELLKRACVFKSEESKKDYREERNKIKESKNKNISFVSSIYPSLPRDQKERIDSIARDLYFEDVKRYPSEKDQIRPLYKSVYTFRALESEYMNNGKIMTNDKILEGS